jgi:N-acetylmuramoyl-L-alanine amidase
MAGNSANVKEMEEAAALMRDAGLTVLEYSGWESIGRSSDLYPWALIDHHTAATNDITSMLVNGRSDLPGPLCNFELREYGDWCLIASGRANHAGEASVSNSESYGIEATGPQNYPDTYGPAAFPHNYDSYITGVACILAAMGAEVADTLGHKEIAPTRKIDPYFDMGSFRKGVAAGGGEEQDMTGEEHNWLKALYQGWVVSGTTTVEDTVNKLYNNVKETKAALAASGTTGPEETIEILFSRIRTIEDAVAVLVRASGNPWPPPGTASDPDPTSAVADRGR